MDEVKQSSMNSVIVSRQHSSHLPMEMIPYNPIISLRKDLLLLLSLSSRLVFHQNKVLFVINRIRSYGHRIFLKNAMIKMHCSRIIIRNRQ